MPTTLDQMLMDLRRRRQQQLDSILQQANAMRSGGVMGMAPTPAGGGGGGTGRQLVGQGMNLLGNKLGGMLQSAAAPATASMGPAVQAVTGTGLPGALAPAVMPNAVPGAFAPATASAPAAAAPAAAGSAAGAGAAESGAAAGAAGAAALGPVAALAAIPGVPQLGAIGNAAMTAGNMLGQIPIVGDLLRTLPGVGAFIPPV